MIMGPTRPVSSDPIIPTTRIDRRLSALSFSLLRRCYSSPLVIRVFFMTKTSGEALPPLNEVFFSASRTQ